MYRPLSLKSWYGRFPPDGAWVYSRKRATGRFTWRGLTPVLSTFYGDYEFQRRPVTTRRDTCVFGWQHTYRTQRPVVFISSTVAVTLDYFDRLEFSVYRHVPSGTVCRWGHRDTYATGYRVGSLEWIGQPYPPDGQGAFDVARGLAGLIEHRPDDFETFLTTRSWHDGLPFLHAGLTAQLHAARDLMLAQACADLMDFPDLLTIPEEDAFELLGDRYEPIIEHLRPLLATARQDLGRVAQWAQAYHAAQAAAYMPQLEAYAAREAARVAQEQARLAQRERDLTALLARTGHDEFGEFVPYHNGKFDAADLELYLRSHPSWFTDQDAARAGRFVRAEQTRRMQSSTGRAGQMRTIYGQRTQDHRAAVLHFWPSMLSTAEHLALIRDRDRRRADLQTLNAARSTS